MQEIQFQFLPTESQWLLWLDFGFAPSALNGKTFIAESALCGGGEGALGWSFGGASALVLLADPGIVPPQLYQTIEPYLHSLVLYDPPFEALGHIPPQLPEFYNAFSDPEYTTFDAKFANFQHWISSYFPHPDIASANAAGMFFAKAPTESANSTFGRWTNEEKMEYSDAAAALRADLPALSPAMQATLRAQFHSALFAPEIVSSYFPRTTILYISGAATCYPGMWGYMASYAMYTTAQARGDSLRATTFRLLEGENHFIHYDAPEVLLREIVAGCTRK